MTSLIGNKPAREILRRLVAAGRVPNALLFAGPEGVGKKQFAIELARRFVCTAPSAGDACGECPACKRAGTFAIPTFEKGEESDRVFFSQHPDVGMVVPFKRNLRIGAIRALEREANFLPFEAQSRIFIIEDADKMNDPSSNALLKTLEEPPPTSHIVLIASREDSLLPTIRSRCQTIRFAPVSAKEIEEYLVGTGEFSGEDAVLAANVCGGSIGRALSIVPASFRTQRSSMLGVLKAAVADNKRDLLSASEEMNDARNKEEYDEKLVILQDLIHDVWLLRNGAGREGILNLEIGSDLAELADRVESPVLSSWLTEIETMKENFIVNLNRKVATDALFLKMTA
jgi:DNA polymerase III subunit delta'